MVSAVNIYGPGGKRPQSHMRAESTEYNPLAEETKLVADRMWEDAMALSKVLAPDVPADAEPMDDFDVWWLLEEVAVDLSPMVWDDPAAIEDLIRLRRQFAPEMDSTPLRTVATLRRREKAMLPDPAVTPQSEEWAAKQKRLAG